MLGGEGGTQERIQFSYITTRAPDPELRGPAQITSLHSILPHVTKPSLSPTHSELCGEKQLWPSELSPCGL